MVIRPGSMMRTDSGKSSDRIPRIGVLDTDSGTVEYVELPSDIARPYSEVFYSEKKAVDAGSVSSLSRFVRQMQDGGRAVMDITTAIKSQLDVVSPQDRGFIEEDLAGQGFLF